MYLISMVIQLLLLWEKNILMLYLQEIYLNLQWMIDRKSNIQNDILLWSFIQKASVHNCYILRTARRFWKCWEKWMGWIFNHLISNLSYMKSKVDIYSTAKETHGFTLPIYLIESTNILLYLWLLVLQHFLVITQFVESKYADFVK